MLRRTNISRLAPNYAKNFHTGLNVAGNPNQSYLVAGSIAALFGLRALWRLNHDRSRGAKLLESEAEVPAELYATAADSDPSPFMDRQRYYADPLEAPSAVSRRNAELAARDNLSSKRVMTAPAIESGRGAPLTGTGAGGGGLGATAVPSGSGGMLGTDAQARFWDRWFDKEGNAADEVPTARDDKGVLGTIKAALFANAHEAAERAKEVELKGAPAVASQRIADAATTVRREEAALAQRTREAAAAAEADVKGYLGRKMDKVDNSAQLENVSHQTEAKEDQGWQGVATVPADVKRSTGRPITQAERGPITPAAAHTGLFGWIGDKAEGLKEAVVGGADDAKAAAETAARAARREAGDIGRDARMAVADAAAQANAAARDAEHEARGLLGSIKDKIVGVKNDAEDAAAKVVDDVKTTSKNIERDVAAGIDKADHEARGFFGSVKDKLLGTADNAEAAVRDAASDVANAADRAKRDINDAEHEARGLLGSIKDKIVGVKNDAEDAAAKVVDDAQTTSKQIQRDVTAGIDKADHEARGFFGSVKDKILGTADNAEAAVRDAASDVVNAADRAKRDINIAARDTARTVANATDLAKRDVAAGVDKAEHEARGFLGSVKDKILGTADNAETAVRDAASDVANAADRAKRDINNAARAVEDNGALIQFGWTADKLPGAKDEAVANAIDDAKTASANIQRNLASRADDIERDTRGLFGTIKDKIVSTAHEAANATQDAKTAIQQAAVDATNAQRAPDTQEGLIGTIKRKLAGDENPDVWADERGIDVHRDTKAAAKNVAAAAGDVADEVKTGAHRTVRRAGRAVDDASDAVGEWVDERKIDAHRIVRDAKIAMNEEEAAV